MESAMRRARSGNLTRFWSSFRSSNSRQPPGGPAVFPTPGADFGSGPDASTPSSWAAPVPADRILALVVMVGRVRGLFRRGELYPRAIRFSTIVIALFFAAFARGRCSAAAIQRSFAYTQTRSRS
jgi:hypothetical protein